MLEKTFETPHGTIHYWVGQGAPADAPWLVLLPGLTADHNLFAPQLDYFEGRCNLLTWDAPAHAASRPWAGAIDLDEFARLVQALLQREGARRFVLVGQSLGGYVSQVLMALYPGQAAGFVSIDSAPLTRSYYAGWEVWALKHTHLMYLSIPWKLLIRWGAGGCSTTDVGKRYMEEAMGQYGKREYCRLAADGYAALAHTVETPRAYDITCPMLVLCGTRDAAGSTKRYNRAWQQRQGVNLVWVPDAGHNSTIDAPDFINAHIEGFVAGCVGCA